MKTILLAGGNDTLPAEEASTIPKAMVDIGGRPILTRVMEIYSRFGHSDFIVATGHQSVTIKQFFANYHLMANDIRITLDTGKIKLRPSHGAGWEVAVVDTGAYTSDSGRVRLLRDWIGDETFMVAYADGLGNVDIGALLDFHREHGKLASVTAVRPQARLGGLELLNCRVTALTGTLRGEDSWINGGFFVFEPTVFDYLVDDQEPLEGAPLAQLAQDGELMAFRHYGFWHPMDTIRDRRFLSRHCTAQTPPWLQFDSRPVVKAAE
ncbi:MAG TPA: glucose-1-phosphate cytidylyltransferase [Paracoccus sp. (in: a-proteobacteria)]|uniref:glucose-1-phosphate cytidylyltransferase n=1 Tax=uncultured Paracoccus sp. TaxID=189685 RepID=UPI00262B4A27|nr:glucose-1-phosphate cytidylyltransferase [uncultured Paracoccus sp.]HMQ41476.1 glucose-1-phosphate cytidylyltransferase [Paracoccus sp. (in: a-proteobacteria)]HMR36061.1 glucose-1-phosphate cytidylyltransferase [Paracoccus sp. (in: a-proteobacteria)]